METRFSLNGKAALTRDEGKRSPLDHKIEYIPEA
jgi:hypothetical protein